jgi:two-component system sensor histidine kinase UhpB
VLLALGVSAAAGLLLVYLAIGAALRPLSALSAGFAAVGDGNEQVRVKLGGPPELIGLQTGFNDMVQRLTAMNRRNRMLEAQLITLQEEERADLARDLHDEIGPHLFAINVDAEIVGQSCSGEARDRIRSIQGSVSHLQKLVREILGRLRPSRATELGLDSAIRDLIAFWRARAPTIDFQYGPLADEAVLDEPVKDAVYRIVQESLNNAVRHAGAGWIEVRIAAVDATEVEIRVSDDGAPEASPNSGGFGLIGMRERVKSVGGTLVIDQHGEGGGWSIIARLPMQVPAYRADQDAAQ